MNGISFRVQERNNYSSSILKLYSKTKLPYSNLSKVKNLFDAFDTEQKGEINVAEVVNFIEEKNLAKEFPFFSSIMQQLNSQGTTTTSFENLILKMLEIIELNEENSTLENCFDFLDYKRQGYLDLPSIKKALAEQGKDLEESDADRMFKAMDKDNDGRISFSEFMAYLEGNLKSEN